MATPKTGRPRGRPAGTTKDFINDPDGVALAYAWYLISHGWAESEAYTTAVSFTDTYNMNSSGTLEPEQSLKVRDALVRRRADSLRKKGTRWRADPAAVAHVEDLTNQMVVVADHLEAQESGDLFRRLWEAWRAL